MTPRSTILLAASLAAAIAVATGCGGGDEADGESSADITITTSSLDKPQFVKKVLAVCEDERSQIPARFASYERKNSSGSQSYEGGIRAVILPTFQAEVTRISKLGAPAGEETRVEAILTAQQEAIDEVSDLESIPSINEVVPHFAEANQLIRRYGLTNCLVLAEPGSG